MTQRNADVAKHVFAQLRERIRFDPVLSKYGFILVEAETAKPRPDVHRCQSPCRAAAMMGRGKYPVQNPNIPAISCKKPVVPRQLFPSHDRARLTRRANQAPMVTVVQNLDEPAPFGRGPSAGADHLILTNAPQAAASPAAVRT